MCVFSPLLRYYFFFFPACWSSTRTCFPDCCGSLIFSIKRRGREKKQQKTRSCSFIFSSRGHSWAPVFPPGEERPTGSRCVTSVDGQTFQNRDKLHFFFFFFTPVEGAGGLAAGPQRFPVSGRCRWAYSCVFHMIRAFFFFKELVSQSHCRGSCMKRPFSFCWFFMRKGLRDRLHQLNLGLESRLQFFFFLG